MPANSSEAPAPRRRIDLAVAAVVVAFAAGAYGLTYTFEAVPQALMQGLGAELFPRLVLATMILLAVLLALGVGASKMDRPAPAPPMVWLTAAALIVFMGLVELVGMWPASFVFLIGLGRLWGEKNLLGLAASALGLCLALYFLFVRTLGATFPRGLLADLMS